MLYSALLCYSLRSQQSYSSNRIRSSSSGSNIKPVELSHSFLSLNFCCCCCCSYLCINTKFLSRSTSSSSTFYTLLYWKKVLFDVPSLANTQVLCAYETCVLLQFWTQYIYFTKGSTYVPFNLALQKYPNRIQRLILFEILRWTHAKYFFFL